jgi:hypothetical protein
MVKLRSKLSIHRNCVAQSSLSHALCYRGDVSSIVVQFCAFVLNVATSALYRLDGGQQIGIQPVAFYAAVFFLVNATYIALIWELIDRTPVEVSPAVRRIMRVRSMTTLCLFGLAAVVALKYPLVGLSICICCLIVYLKPDPPGEVKKISQG